MSETAFFVERPSGGVEIPFRDVAKVTGTRLVNPPRITLHLRQPGALGDRVVFVPPMRLITGLRPHPLTKELQEVVSRAALR